MIPDDEKGLGDDGGASSERVPAAVVDVEGNSPALISCVQGEEKCLSESILESLIDGAR